MGEFGDAFRHRRAEMNLSLKEVENATSIRSSYLQAIEDGSIGNLISPVYAKGFVKQYAQFLGMDGEKLVLENADMFQLAPQGEFVHGIGTLEVRDTGGSGVKWLPNLLWAGVTVGALVAAWYFAKYLGVV